MRHQQEAAPMVIGEPLIAPRDGHVGNAVAIRHPAYSLAEAFHTPSEISHVDPVRCVYVRTGQTIYRIDPSTGKMTDKDGRSYELHEYIKAGMIIQGVNFGAGDPSDPTAVEEIVVVLEKTTQHRFPGEEFTIERDFLERRNGPGIEYFLR